MLTLVTVTFADGSAPSTNYNKSTFEYFAHFVYQEDILVIRKTAITSR